MSEPRLLMLGGGHAHIQVLKAMAKQGLPKWHVQMLTPHPKQIYSGMLPGWIAGVHDLEACTIDLIRLTQASGVHFHSAQVTALDLVSRFVVCDDGTRHPFAQLSINTGSIGSFDEVPEELDHILHIRPVHRFIARWSAFLSRLRAGGSDGRLLVLGGGAASVELAIAIRQLFRKMRWPAMQIQLVGAHATPLHGFPQRAIQQVMQALSQAGIEWRGHCRVQDVRAHELVLHNARPLSFDACLLCTGASAPAWLRESGLGVDPAGFVLVNDRLQSQSHSHVWAAGDIAALPSARPKSGVYAVRAGNVLSNNVQSACMSRPLRRWQPQRHALNLINLGERQTLGVWGPITWTGTGPYYLKDWIDRTYIQALGAHP